MASNNEVQSQEPKSILEKAVDKSKELADKALEATPQSLKDMAKEMHALVDTEAAKEVVAKNPRNSKFAKMAAETTMESRDGTIVDGYLSSINGTEARSISPEDQLALLKAVQRSRPEVAFGSSTEPRNFDDAAGSYGLVGRLPEAQQALIKEYQDGLAKGYYKNFVPSFIKGLPIELQQEVHDGNPDGFAKSFPNSELTAGPELQKLVDEDISSNFNGTAMRMGSSSVGRPESVLDNPNLSSTQVNELAKSFLQIGYNGNPEKNPDYFQATEKVSNVFMKFYRNGNLSPENKKALVYRFGKQVGVSS